MPTPAQKIASTKRTKKYKALIAIGIDENTALKQLGHETDPTDERYQRLIDGGFTPEEAYGLLGLDRAQAPTPAPVKELTAKDLADQLVTESGYTYTKGCVYASGDILEAAVRVRKTGRPEWIASSGVGRTKAVVLYRTDHGDVAIQNLTKPAESA